MDFTKKNCENYTQDIYEKVSRDLGSGFKMIREIQLKDKEQWEKLYRGYAVFYKFINILSKKFLRLKRIGINKEKEFNI